MKTEYQITIGYRAVVTVTVKAESEDEAKKLGLDYFRDKRNFGAKANIEDDSYKVDGILNMDNTWNAL